MSSLTLWSENRQEYLKIEQIAEEIYGSCQQWRIEGVQGAFSGSIAAWIDRAALENFLTQLRECERLRRGEAKLEAISPEECWLRVVNTRAKGDFAVHYQISQDNWEFPARLQGGFALDPGLLLQILREFEELGVSD